MNQISDKAVISPKAKIGNNVKIFPFVYIEDYVEIGDNCTIFPFVSILNGTKMGKDNKVHQGTVIGAFPQDFEFQGERSEVIIGDNNTIRENVTINRGTAAKGCTIVGSNNLLMEGMHVAHDVCVGSGCIIGNSTKIAGEVVVDDFAIISANVLVHQFCHIGSYVMVGGGTRTGQDIPPFTMAAREPVAYCGLNLVGLRRRGFTPELIENIHNTYRLLYQRGKLREECLAEIREQVPMSPEIEYILEFVHSSKRGIIK